MQLRSNPLLLTATIIYATESAALQNQELIASCAVEIITNIQRGKCLIM